MATEIYLILSEIMKQRNFKIADIARICNLPDSTVRGIITRKQNTARSAPVITLPVLGMTAEEPVRVLWLPEPMQPAAAGLGQPADDEETENVPVVYMIPRAARIIYCA